LSIGLPLRFAPSALTGVLRIRVDGLSLPAPRGWFITPADRCGDVQLLAGHRSIQTTQRYIDGDSDAQRKLVSMI
jgi:hypothetical protein